MTTQQAILKCNKKAWKEIKAIKTASNMLTVEQAVSDAIEKTFGFWNKGMLMIGMRRLGQMGEFERTMSIRRANFDNHLSVIRGYLIDLIPEKFYKTLMYQKLAGRFPS